MATLGQINAEEVRDILERPEDEQRSLSDVVLDALQQGWVVSPANPETWMPFTAEDGAWVVFENAEAALGFCEQESNFFPVHILGTDPRWDVVCLESDSDELLSALLKERELPEAPNLRLGQKVFRFFKSVLPLDGISEVGPGVRVLGSRGLVPVPGAVVGDEIVAWEDATCASLPEWLMNSALASQPSARLLANPLQAPREVRHMDASSLSPFNLQVLAGIDNFGQLAFGNFLAKRYSNLLRYEPEGRRWLCWGGHSWIEDSEKPLRLLERIRLDVEDMEVAARQHPEEKARKALLSDVGNHSTMYAFGQLVSFLETHTSLHVRVESLDSDPYLLGTPNGVVDLEDGAFRDGNPSDLITRQTRAIWDTTAQCPLWEDFLQRSFGGDQEKINYLQTLAGYALTGDTSEKAFIFLLGQTNAGKGAFCNTLIHTLGDYATTAGKETVMNSHKRAGGSSHSEDRVRLRGARFVSIAETSKTDEVDEDFIKKTTGEDHYAARSPYGKRSELILSTWKYFIQTNVVPKMSTDDTGMRNRLVAVRFPLSFVGSDRDPTLKRRLLDEAPGVLQWAYRGFLRWKAQGLEAPQVVKDETAALWEAVKAPFDRWFDERVVVNINGRALSSELLEDCLSWHSTANLRPPSDNALGRYLTDRLGENSRGRGKERFYTGISLVPKA